ncbi:hypothetical protein BpHYR1_007753 [Brachionus plicatilis]|uniref:Uncharacterized protein n=1 Tax=Brachionus plicatilis TaxID=10195 RepID=A0A3M7RNU7_BRAPC|nr:hypothetical protein BpHYR1_007753 [Brachionus plicatilis]
MDDFLKISAFFSSALKYFYQDENFDKNSIHTQILKDKLFAPRFLNQLSSAKLKNFLNIIREYKKQKIYFYNDFYHILLTFVKDLRKKKDWFLNIRIKLFKIIKAKARNKIKIYTLRNFEVPTKQHKNNPSFKALYIFLILNTNLRAEKI